MMNDPTARYSWRERVTDPGSETVIVSGTSIENAGNVGMSRTSVRSLVRVNDIGRYACVAPDVQPKRVCVSQ